MIKEKKYQNSFDLQYLQDNLEFPALFSSLFFFLADKLSLMIHF